MNTQADPSGQDRPPATRIAAEAFHRAVTVETILRLEGLAVLAMAIFAYIQAGQSWWLFAALFLSPDLSLVAYLLGPRTGATIYNLFHCYAGAAVLWLAGVGFANPLLAAIALIWFAHIGFDRALGYGLKFTTGFHHTHLGSIGRSAPVAADLSCSKGI